MKKISEKQIEANKYSNVYYQNRKKIRASLPDNCACPYCNVIMLKDAIHHPSSVTIDHIHPHSKGGADTMDNLVAVCKNCNGAKSSLTEVNLFYFNESQLVDFKDYAALNKYVKHFNRYTVLKEMMRLLVSEDLLALAEMVDTTSKTNNSATYFRMILRQVQTNINRSTNFKKNHKQSVNWLKCLLKCEKKHFDGFESQVSHLNFSVYSVITTNRTSKEIRKAA